MRTLRLVAAVILAIGPLLAYAAGCTSTIPDTAKLDIMSGVHSFAQPYAVGVAYKIGQRITSGTTPVKLYELTAAFTGTGLSVTAPVGTTTESDNGGTWTYKEAAPIFKFVIIKSGMAGTYGAATNYYSDVTGNSDEVGNSGTYTAGGVTLTGLTIAAASNHAQVDFADVSITSSPTISGACAVIVNTTKGNRVVSVHDFGGTKASTADTWTATIAAGTLAFN